MFNTREFYMPSVGRSPASSEPLRS